MKIGIQPCFRNGAFTFREQAREVPDWHGPPSMVASAAHLERQRMGRSFFDRSTGQRIETSPASGRIPYPPTHRLFEASRWIRIAACARSESDASSAA